MQHITNNYSIHEDNVVFEAAYILRDLGYNITLKEYMGKVDDSAAHCDLVVYQKNSEVPLCIGEFKNRRNITYNGPCDCSDPPTPQLEKYCKLNYPLYVCNGFNNVDSFIWWVIDQDDKISKENEN